MAAAESLPAIPTVSVIVPCRNEQQHIGDMPPLYPGFRLAARRV